MGSRILKEVHDTAKDMHDIGTIDTTTMREFDALCLPPIKKLTRGRLGLYEFPTKLVKRCLRLI